MRMSEDIGRIRIGQIRTDSVRTKEDNIGQCRQISVDFGSDKFGQIRVGQKRTKGDSVGQKRTDEDSGQDRTISVRTILLAGQNSSFRFSPRGRSQRARPVAPNGTLWKKFPNDKAVRNILEDIRVCGYVESWIRDATI